jgi:hypothetical protein
MLVNSGGAAWTVAASSGLTANHARKSAAVLASEEMALIATPPPKGFFALRRHGWAPTAIREEMLDQ